VLVCSLESSGKIYLRKLQIPEGAGLTIADMLPITYLKRAR